MVRVPRRTWACAVQGTICPSSLPASEWWKSMEKCKCKQPGLIHVTCNATSACTKHETLMLSLTTWIEFKIKKAYLKKHFTKKRPHESSETNGTLHIWGPKVAQQKASRQVTLASKREQLPNLQPQFTRIHPHTNCGLDSQLDSGLCS